MTAQRHGDVHVIFGAAHRVRGRIARTTDGGKVGVQFALDAGVNQRRTVLCAEDHVNEDVGQRLGHDRNARLRFRPFRASTTLYSFLSPGFTRSYHILSHRDNNILIL